MKFAAQNYLWFLLLAPLLAAFLWWSWRSRRRLITQFVPARLLATLTAGVSPRRQKLRMSLLVAAVALAAFALARPQWGYHMEEAKHRGLDILVAIDTSRSMLAEDAKPNRLERAKLAALDLMKLAKNDRLGLVAFAGSAFLQCPLTLDDEAFRQSVGALDVGIMPQGGSSLAQAIATAAAAFKDEKENHRVLVLITDGEEHEPEALAAAAKASKEGGLKIFTIGIGTPDGELIRVPDDKGKLAFLRDDSGNIVKSRLNETLLQKISGATEGGFYLNLRGVNTMEMLYEKGLAPLPKAELNAKMVRRYHERFYVPLSLAILFLLLEIFLPERKAVFAGEPSRAAGPLKVSVALLMLLALPFAARASPSTAMKDYKAGKYDSAAKEFQRLQDDHPDDARYSYNAGTAAYQAKDYEHAARHFSAAQTSPELLLQQKAYYNSGNTWYWLGETAKEADERTDLWEQAVKYYDGALKLDKEDKDAKFNREFVKKKLEKLKQEQEQQKPSQKGKSEKKKDKQPGDQTPGEDGEDGDEPKPKDGKGKKEDGKKKDGGKKKEERTNEEAGPDAGKQSNEQQQQQNADGQMDKEEQRKMALGQMTIQQAKQLLEAMKGEDRALIFRPSLPGEKQQPRKFKDW